MRKGLTMQEIQIESFQARNKFKRKIDNFQCDISPPPSSPQSKLPNPKNLLNVKRRKCKHSSKGKKNREEKEGKEKGGEGRGGGFCRVKQKKIKKFFSVFRESSNRLWELKSEIKR